MRISLGRPAGLLTLALVSSGLVAILLLTALSAQSTAGSLPTSEARSVGAASVAPSRVFHSLPSLNVPRSPAAEEAFAAWPEQPLAADFMFDKKVTLRSDFYLLGCNSSVDSLSVYYSTTVAYCYFFTNIGTTTWVTHTLVDDKLGSFGAMVENVSPNGQTGFGVVPPALLQDVTNTATWTSTDEDGNQLARTDEVTVNVVIPLTGHIFIDLNGDGVRDSDETEGLGSVTVDLQPQPWEPDLARQTTSSATGYFEFLDAVEGTYTVSVQLPVGYVATTPTQAPITLVFGVNKRVDFGARQATVTPTPTDASTSTATPTPDSSPTATATVTEEPTPTETATPDGTPTVTPSPTPLVPTTSIRKVYLPALIHVPSGMQPPLAPSLRHIDSPGGQLTYLLSWTPVLGAASYELQQAPTPDFDRDVQSVYQGQDSAFDMSSHGIGTFYYRVRARNVAGASDWSEVRSADVSWETEPNSLLTAANSGLVSGQTIYALPDDPNDFFHVTTTKAGSITAQIEGIVGESVRLVLYSDNIGNVIATDTTAPYEIRAYREPGNYYIRVFVGMGHSATTPYRLVVTYK